ncbi:hypothetical protein [Sphingomonas sp. 1P08PE]|uniref:hypothetical protein n=1 Tax=Sphingomonas sp. 1P08PE TaxID=554122 RepID=UPI0039A3DC21
MTDRIDPATSSVMAHLAAELGMTARREPWDMDRIAALVDAPARRDLVTDLLCGIMPATLDGEQWVAWVQGGQPPLPVRLQDPDKGDRPSARGAMQAASARHQAVAAKVARLEAQLTQARQELALAEADLQRAGDQVRTVVAYRLMVEIGRQASGIALGPLYAVARAISPYLQHDIAFENGLDDEGRARLGERRASREEDSREMLDRLDRYAGEPGLELKLHRAMLKVIRAFHDEREVENAAARKAGRRLPGTRKQQAVRRSIEAQQRSVHPAAPCADVVDVFNAFPGFEAGSADEPEASDPARR